MKLSKKGRPYAKFPKLMETHQTLFKTIPNNLHNSLIDIYVCFRCFHMLEYGFDIREKKEFKKEFNRLCGLKISVVLFYVFFYDDGFFFFYDDGEFYVCLLFLSALFNVNNLICVFHLSTFWSQTSSDYYNNNFFVDVLTNSVFSYSK